QRRRSGSFNIGERVPPQRPGATVQLHSSVCTTMFGLLRFLLSSLVVLSHLSGSIYAMHFGYYAVRAFFVVSGFLMTAALNEVYRFDGVRFWTSRLLRLLPLYYLVCLFTLAVLAQFPVESEQFHLRWRINDTLAAWELDGVMNLMVLPLQYASPEF